MTINTSRRDFIWGSTIAILGGCGGAASVPASNATPTSPEKSELARPPSAKQFVNDRILFPGNPWPAGHKIKDFVWSAELTKEGDIWCHLHLKSENYDAEDKDSGQDNEPEDVTNWHSKVVWGNYHKCILSSTYWGHAGFLVGTREEPFALESFDGKTYSIDPMPFGIDESPSFGIYCQGHDTAANHEITFHKTAEGWIVDWSGMIALTYLGATDFEHQFVARKTAISFDGVAISDGIGEEEAKLLFRGSVINPDQYQLKETKLGRRFQLRPTDKVTG